MKKRASDECTHMEKVFSHNNLRSVSLLLPLLLPARSVVDRENQVFLWVLRKNCNFEWEFWGKTRVADIIEGNTED